MMTTKLWDYVGPADRETLLSAVVAWLLDPNGSHGLKTVGRDFLAATVGEGQFADPKEVGVERTAGRGRVDVQMKLGDGQSVAIEIKTKSVGSLAQVEKYAKYHHRVLRLAFDTFNFEGFEASASNRYPLLRLDEFVGIVERELTRAADAPMHGFLTQWCQALREESGAMRRLHEIVRNGSMEDWPDASSIGRTGDRFLSGLIWSWVIAKEEEAGRQGFRTRADTSGVWLSAPGAVAKEGESLSVAEKVEIQGPTKAWYHLEIGANRSPLAQGPIGKIELRFSGDHPVRLENWGRLRRCRSQLAERGIRLSGRRPSESYSYWSPLRCDLLREDLRDPLERAHARLGIESPA